jgi:hypothetical protein
MVTSSQGDAFNLNLLKAFEGNIAGASSSNKNPNEIGTAHGKKIDATHAEITFTQPGLGRTGAIDLALGDAGFSFIGFGQVNPSTSVTWKGLKTALPMN